MDSEGRTLWIVDAHRDNGKRFVVRSDEMLSAFLELERITHELAVRRFLAMTVIEVKPRKWGWCVFESPGVEPVFLEKDQAIGFAETRARLRIGEIRILDSRGDVERTIHFSEADRKLWSPRCGARKLLFRSAKICACVKIRVSLTIRPESMFADY